MNKALPTRPLQPGTVIEYAGIEATVIMDNGGVDLLVNAEGCRVTWRWDFCGESCKIVTVPSKSYKIIERVNVADIERFIVYPFCDENDTPSAGDGYIEVRHNGCISLNFQFRQPLSREDWLRLVSGVEAAFDIAERNKMGTREQELYKIETKIVEATTRHYNPEYGDDRVCQCGHLYYRHFNSYEKMAAVGCKYCGCDTFSEAPVNTRG